MVDAVPVADEEAGASVAESAPVEHDSARLPDAQVDIAKSVESSDAMTDAVPVADEKAGWSVAESVPVEHESAGLADALSHSLSLPSSHALRSLSLSLSLSFSLTGLSLSLSDRSIVRKLYNALRDP
jgi:hypothetical protein